MPRARFHLEIASNVETSGFLRPQQRKKGILDGYTNCCCHGKKYRSPVLPYHGKPYRPLFRNKGQRYASFLIPSSLYFKMPM